MPNILVTTKGTEDPKTNPSVPQQEKQTDATGGKVAADYKPDEDYEGSEPKNEPDAKEEKEENYDADDRTFHQRMMHHNVLQRTSVYIGKDYGVMAPEYVDMAWIQSQRSQVACQRQRTRQS